MSSLASKRLGEIGTFKNGVNFTKTQMGAGQKVINVKNLYCDTIWFDDTHLDRVDLGTSFSPASDGVREGDIFFVRSSVKRSWPWPSVATQMQPIAAL
jgi:type I restriction enzyme S subunit